MTIQQANQQLLFALYHLYESREAKNIADLVMENLTEWKKIDRLLNKHVVLSAEKKTRFNQLITELSTGKPVQYVLQEAWFYGMKFFVNENVLIPRPETEELVSWVIETTQSLTNRSMEFQDGAGKKLLDVGTGSGCIPVAIKRSLPQLDVYTCDLSEPALEVARQNAEAFGTSITTMNLDFLAMESRNSLPEADILVSNPPYIPLSEKKRLANNVTSFEPHSALFVPDQDPLLFYKALIDFMFGQQRSMRVFAEIHEDFNHEMLDLFQRAGLRNIELRNDMQGKQRMISATRELAS